MMNEQLRNLRIDESVKKLECTKNKKTYTELKNDLTTNTSLIWGFKHTEAAKRHMMFINNKIIQMFFLVLNLSNDLGDGLDCWSPYVGPELKDEHVKAWEGNKRLLLDSQKQQVLFIKLGLTSNLTTELLRFWDEKGYGFTESGWERLTDITAVLLWCGPESLVQISKLVVFERIVVASVYVE